jgi:predicted nucleic acid-binding protein
VSYLVDTNVLSEAVKPLPDLKVMAWLRKHEREIYISAITIGEIRRGIERLGDGKRKTELQEWLQELCRRTRGRILSFNTSTANIWGQLKAQWDRKGVTMGSLDSQIAATASRYGLILVTRNDADFKQSGVTLTNPFNP